LISDTAKNDSDLAHLLQRINEEVYAIRQRKASLPKYVREIPESYKDKAVAMDDICLVSIDISKAKKR
jgi:hypothetical protein